MNKWLRTDTFTHTINIRHNIERKLYKMQFQQTWSIGACWESPFPVGALGDSSSMVPTVDACTAATWGKLHYLLCWPNWMCEARADELAQPRIEPIANKTKPIQLTCIWMVCAVMCWCWCIFLVMVVMVFLFILNNNFTSKCWRCG